MANLFKKSFLKKIFLKGKNMANLLKKSLKKKVKIF